jgi:predicted transcriptional regulator
MDPLQVFIIIFFAFLVPAGLGTFFVWANRKQMKAINAKVSDQQIIELARQNKGELNPVMLAEQTGLTLSEAKAKINAMLMSGLIQQRWDWKDWQNPHNKYILKGADKDYPNTQLPENTNPKPFKINKITDAEVIALAAQNKGLMTVSTLCVKLNISIDEAKQKLEELRQKEVFITEVGENGGLIYRLIDGDLMV